MLLGIGQFLPIKSLLLIFLKATSAFSLFHVIFIIYGAQSPLVDEFELIFWQFCDNMIEMNVVCGINFKGLTAKIFLKEICQF